MKTKTEAKVLLSQYLHIGNSGVTFSVLDLGYGPTLRMSSSAGGNMQNEFTLFVRRSNLRALGDMLLAAAELDYSPDYCNVTMETRTLVPEPAPEPAVSSVSAIGDGNGES